MSVFRTTSPNIIFTIPGSPAIVITSSGTLVSDTLDATIIATAASNSVILIQGGSVGTPINTSSLNYVTSSDMQSYVAGQLQPPDELSRFHNALAKRFYSPVRILVIGDSLSEGQGATVKSRRWIEMLQSRLRFLYPVSGVAGGEGYVASAWNQTSFATGWSYGGNVAADGTFGWGHRSVVLKSPDGFATRTVNGTSIKICYTKNTALGSFSVFLDGSGTATATINTATGASSTTHDGGTATVSLGTRGSHTVKLAWASGGNCIVNGMYVYDQDESSGIMVVDSGQYGSKTGQWVAPDNVNQYVIGDDVAELQPPLCIIELGPNDYLQNVDPAVTGANFVTLINQVAAACTVPPSFVLIGDYQVAGTQTYQWTQYLAAMKAVADSRTDTLYCNLTLGMLSPPPNNTGLYDVDNVHINDNGHSRIADTVTSFITKY